MAKSSLDDLRKGLAGKGMGRNALFGGALKDVPPEEETVAQKTVATPALAELLEVSKIEPNPYQPRKVFDSEALQTLSDSLKLHGVIQPITVRRLSSEAYQLIAGERRWRAAKLARLERIPAYIREANDAEMMELAIIENIQRSDLNPIEEAVAYKNLMLHCGLTQEDVAERVKKGRSTVTNILGLLSLPLNMQDAVKEQKISLGHGKLLIGVKEDLGIQTAVFKAILEQELSIRETEHLIESYINKVKKSNTQAKKDTIPSAYRLVEDKLSAFFGSKVQMKYTENGAGQITIRYNSADDLTRILEVIEDKK